MKKCLYCRSNIKDDAKFCNKCGAEIKEEIKKEEVVVETQVDNEETLLKYYVGDKYDKINKQTASFSTFFFGPLYFAYRKLFAFSILWILVNFFIENTLQYLINIDAWIIELIISFALSFNFKEIYLWNAKRKIKKIQNKYSNISKEELNIKLSHKGGTSILLPIMILFIFILMLIFIYIIYYLAIGNIKVTQSQIGNLNYSIAEGYEKVSSSENKVTYDDSDSSCSFTVVVDDSKIIIKEYLTKYIGSNNYEITTHNEDDIEWLQTSYNNNIYYAARYNNKNYLIEYKLDDSDKCVFEEIAMSTRLEFNK